MTPYRPASRLVWLVLGTVLAAAAAGAAPSTCGNGMLDGGETCDACPADCRASTCTPGQPRTVTVALTPQQGVGKVGAVGILLAFRPTVLTLPGEGNDPAVSARVTPRQAGAQVWVNDLGYAVRIGASRGEPMSAGPLVDVELNACAGAPEPTAADIVCRVESCAFGGGRLRDCACSATVQAATTR